MDGKHILEDFRSRRRPVPIRIPNSILAPDMVLVDRLDILSLGGGQREKRKEAKERSSYFLRKNSRMGTPVKLNNSRRRFSRNRS